MEEDTDAMEINHEELDLTGSHLPDLADVQFPSGLKVTFTVLHQGVVPCVRDQRC